MSRGLETVKKVEVKMSMTPLIDIVFLLLIFFMVASKFKTTEGKIQSFLPRDRGLGTSKAVVPTEVRVKLLWYDLSGSQPTTDKHGRAILKVERRVFPTRVYNEDKCWIAGCGQNHGSPDMDAFYQFILEQKARYQPPPGRDPARGLPVIIDARPQVPWKYVVRVVNACVKAGITDVTFAAAEKPIQ
ncbi:MAG: hypothetical protein KatS3mg102_2153 [Planctomycetota bacterium]|nr:MAG: hypothetical protein KatS3mg102_2153 [Planctomycetota bacterium]